MPRQRTIKPGFFKNEELAKCSPYARLLFAGLWTLADHHGKLVDRPERIKAELLPYDQVDGNELLTELARRGFIRRYAVQRNNFILIPAFKIHQEPSFGEKNEKIESLASLHGN